MKRVNPVSKLNTHEHRYHSTMLASEAACKTHAQQRQQQKKNLAHHYKFEGLRAHFDA